MRIFLIGASGMIGSRILTEALSRGHQVIAAARNPAKIATGPGVTTVRADLANPAGLADLAQGADVIVSATSPRSTGDAVAESHQFGRALLDLARDTGLRLFVVGGAGSLKLPDGSPVLDTLPDLYRAEATGFRDLRDMLRASTADWTFFSPAGLIAPGERTGTFRLGTDHLVIDAQGNSQISAEDYAIAVLDELERPAHRGQQFTIGY